MLKGKCVVLGVTGSIAAYKIAYLASALVKQHADVHVIMTENATNFINPITFETLTSNKCLVDTFDRNFQFNVEHVALAKRADIFMVAPASANVLGKMAHRMQVMIFQTHFIYILFPFCMNCPLPNISKIVVCIGQSEQNISVHFNRHAVFFIFVMLDVISPELVSGILHNLF